MKLVDETEFLNKMLKQCLKMVDETEILKIIWWILQTNKVGFRTIIGCSTLLNGSLLHQSIN